MTWIAFLTVLPWLGAIAWICSCGGRPLLIAAHTDDIGSQADRIRAFGAR